MSVLLEPRARRPRRKCRPDEGVARIRLEPGEIFDLAGVRQGIEHDHIPGRVLRSQ
jgi:hypothetical protein